MPAPNGASYERVYLPDSRDDRPTADRPLRSAARVVFTKFGEGRCIGGSKHNRITRRTIARQHETIPLIRPMATHSVDFSAELNDKTQKKMFES
jgi:hypothetical protein